jgi:DNA-binding NarL/FixJ family response regulator
VSARAVTAVVVDSGLLERVALSEALGNGGGITVVARPPDAESAAREVRSLAPSVAVVPCTDVREVRDIITAIRSARPATQVLVIGGPNDADALDELVSAGANGYLLEQASIDDVVAGTFAVANGERTYPQALLAPLLDSIAKRQEAQASFTRKLARLAPQQRRVLQLLVDGLSTQAMATELEVAPRTVRGHIQSIFQKLDLHSRLEVLAWIRGRVVSEDFPDK